jgi:nucleoside-diphosphate-sugar epimerase
VLEAGDAVRATGRKPDALARLQTMGAEIVAGDLEGLDLQRLCSGRDAVFHAAALSSPWGRSSVFERINIHVTINLLAAAQAARCGSFVFVSSPSIYAALRDQIGLTEKDPPARHPLNAYARTKLIAERAVLAADAPNFRTVAIRPRALIGPDDAVLLPRVLRLVDRGRFPLLRGGRALIELTDVRDAARALILADQRRETVGGRAINISGGKPTSVAALVAALAEATGRTVKTTSIPVGLALAIAGLAEAVCAVLPGRSEPPATRYSIAALAYSQTFDLSFAVEALGFVPAYDALMTARALAADR